VIGVTRITAWTAKIHAPSARSVMNRSAPTAWRHTSKNAKTAEEKVRMELARTIHSQLDIYIVNITIDINLVTIINYFQRVTRIGTL